MGKPPPPVKPGDSLADCRVELLESVGRRLRLLQANLVVSIRLDRDTCMPGVPFRMGSTLASIRRKNPIRASPSSAVKPAKSWSSRDGHDTRAWRGLLALDFSLFHKLNYQKQSFYLI